MTDPMTNDILIETTGRAGRISLNRPRALHALTLDMCHAMSAALTKWASDDAVEAARPAALVWALERGSRSGRVAYQFARDYAGTHAARG